MPKNEHLAPDLAAALAISDHKLAPFEGKDVISAAVEIPGAAGGLVEAMKFDPIELAHDDEAVIVMKVKCVKVRFDEVKDTDALRRVHVLKPIDDYAAIVDEALVSDLLIQQAERIRLAREAAVGVQRLHLAGEGDEADEAEVMVVQHNSGAHSEGEPRPECPLCREEIAAYEAEQAGEEDS